MLARWELKLCVVCAPSLRRLLNIMGHADERLEAEVREVLEEISVDLLTSLLAFGAAMAKRCGEDTVEPHHMALHAMRGWSLQVPGFTGRPVEIGSAPSGPLNLEADTQRMAMARGVSSQHALLARQQVPQAPDGPQRRPPG